MKHAYMHICTHFLLIIFFNLFEDVLTFLPPRLTIANSMLSLIGSLQPDPFDPRHTFSSIDAIEVAATSQKRVDELRKEDEMEVEDALDEVEMGEVERVGDLSVLSVVGGDGVGSDEEDEIEEWTQDRVGTSTAPAIVASSNPTKTPHPVPEIAAATATVTESTPTIVGESGKKKRKRKDKDIVPKADTKATEEKVGDAKDTTVELKADGREDRPKKKKKRKHTTDGDEAPMAMAIDEMTLAKPVDSQALVGGADVAEVVKTEKVKEEKDGKDGKDGKEKKKKRKKEKKEKDRVDGVET